MLCTTASLSHCQMHNSRGAAAGSRARTGSKRHGFWFHGDAPHAPCRHPLDHVLGERCARRASKFAGLGAAATCGHAVTVAIGPEGRSRARHRRDAANCGRTTSPAAGFDHQADAGAARPHARLHRHRRLDPPVRRQGRAASRYRLHLLSARRHRSRQPAGDVSVQRRPGRVLGLAAVRRRRPMARVDIRRGRGVIRDAGPVAQRRDLARLHRSRLHRSRRHRLQPFRRVRRGCAQAVLLGRRRRQRHRARDPALAGKIRPPAVAEIRQPARAMAAFADRRSCAICRPSRASACAG